MHNLVYIHVHWLQFSLNWDLNWTQTHRSSLIRVHTDCCYDKRSLSAFEYLQQRLLQAEDNFRTLRRVQQYERSRALVVLVPNFISNV